MKYRKAATFYVHNGREYTMGKFSHGDFPYSYYHFHSADPSSYPDEILLGADVKIAYRTSIKALVKGEEVFVNEVIGDKIRLHIPPGSRVIKALNAVPDGGWYSAVIPVKMVEEVWEQRYQANDYPAPEGLDSKVPVEF